MAAAGACHAAARVLAFHDQHDCGRGNNPGQVWRESERADRQKRTIRLFPGPAQSRAAFIFLGFCFPDQLAEHTGSDELTGHNMDVLLPGILIGLETEDEIVILGKSRDEQSRERIDKRFLR